MVVGEEVGSWLKWEEEECWSALSPPAPSREKEAMKSSVLA